MSDYKGFIELNENEFSDFYSYEKVSTAIYENEYVIVANELYCYQNKFFRRVGYPTIENKWTNKINTKDIYQRAAVDMLEDRTSKVKVLRGVYGSGKDYLMFNKALSLVENGEFDKIIFIRPNVTLANVPQIGFLPNGIEDKLSWTLAPLYDKVGGEDGIDALVRKDMLEMVPLLFIRGRSFEKCIIYVTEGQNIDSEIAKVLLGRVGENSELWINGDSHQTDNRIFDKDNGITKMVDRLRGNELFAYIYLPTTHRSKVANLANLLDDEDENEIQIS